MSTGLYGNARRLCDLVMKGGITSGVVYPLAVCELAKVYCFKNIGGTSAGAIAAAAAAAAEYGRRTGSADARSFDGLAALPAWIGAPGRLPAMFRPERATRALFGIVTAPMNARTRAGKAAAVAGRLLLHFPVTAAILAAAVWAAGRWLRGGATGAAFAYAVTATVLLALLLFLLVVILFLFRQITRTLPANFYGMSRAFDRHADVAVADAPLTNWLTRYLNELAGKPLSAGPLTFGDLYSAPRPPGDPQPAGAEYKAINLEVMTTALNHGRPYRLPFRDPDRLFYFSVEEFSELFPRIVVDHMVSHAPKRDPHPTQAAGIDRLYEFPAAEDLPIVVATRMSLSFPVLLAAVPLYAVDFTRVENQQDTTPRTAERCWFSDGGICSNLPIHFFDAALPRWPTFGINLKQFHPDHQQEADAVWLPKNNNSGWLPAWTRFEQPGRFGLLSSFLSAMLNAMQNWQDNTQARVPGYRDRLVHVSQREEEGGLNLSMPQEVVTRLSERGKRAGDALVQRFGVAPDPAAAPAAWTEHRWVRFRSCMELTAGWIQHVARAYHEAIPPDPVLETVLLRPPDAPPAAYRLNRGDQQRAKNAVDGLVRLATEWDQTGTGFDKDAPRPTPELRIKARI